MSKEKNQSDISGIAFAGCVVLGIGIGLLLDQAGAGTLIGVGVGLVVMAILRKKA